MCRGGRPPCPDGRSAQTRSRHNGLPPCPTTSRHDAIEIRPAERQVRVDGKPAALGARAFDVLLALYERRERVVGKHELIDLVWPGLVVEENNLQVQVAACASCSGRRRSPRFPGAATASRCRVGGAGAGRAPSRHRRGERRTAPVRTTRRAATCPPQPPLFGRDDDLAAVADAVARAPGGDDRRCRRHRQDAPGAGGCATADALETPDGRWWVELAPLTDGAQVPATIAGALGLQLPAGRPPREALAAALARQRAAARARQLRAPGRRGRAADRAAARAGARRAAARHVAGTAEVRRRAGLPARLAGGAGDATPSSRRRLAFGAVALFVERAHAVDPRFRARRRQRRGGDRHLPPAGRHSAGHRAGRRARAAARRAWPAGAAGPDVQRADRRRRA